MNCGLKLRQIVDKSTRGIKILDVIITNLGSSYKSPQICPPIEADDPSSGKASDQSVPVCVPHCDRFSRPERSYKNVSFRPLPESKLLEFGNWIVNEQWDELKDVETSSEHAEQLDTYLMNKLDIFCPKKSIKLTNSDKPFITIELKKLDRQRNREYLKSGKSIKYYSLKNKNENSCLSAIVIEMILLCHF